MEDPVRGVNPLQITLPFEANTLTGGLVVGVGFDPFDFAIFNINLQATGAVTIPGASGCIFGHGLGKL
jgi:hypothetical protein